MVLRKNKLFLLVLVLNTCLTKLAYGDESSDSDDDRLQQALVLVDILKSEYIKALNENAVLRENINVTSEELSTCATTEGGNVSSSDSNFNQNVTDTNNSTAWTPPSPLTVLSTWPQLAYATQLPTYQDRQPLLPYFQQGPPLFPQQPSQTLGPLIPLPQFYGTTVPPNYPPGYNERLMGPSRRMLPRDYYYFDNARLRNMPFFYRRMQNGDEKENGTGTRNTIFTEHTISPTLHATVKKSTTFKSVTKKNTQSQKIKDQKQLPRKKARWRNPILKEVAEELIKEIDFGSPSTKNTTYSKKKKHLKKAKLRSNSEKNQTKTKGTDRPMFTKTTLRIHMEGSTRLMLPLSENNPYCFFSPKSALCRSSV